MTRPGKSAPSLAQSVARAAVACATCATVAALLMQPASAQTDLQLRSSPMLGQVPTPAATAAQSAPRVRSADATMGMGDQITINVFGQPDLTTQVTLDAVGIITLPLIGAVKALGLQPRQLEQLVAARLVDGGYIRDADVVVTIEQTRSRFFSVLGAVARPGRYPLENNLSLLDALAEAGGATERAEPVVMLIRATDPNTDGVGSTPKSQFDLDPRRGPDPELSAQALRNRDVLFVPAKKVFYVYGEVRSPGVFALEPDLNLLKALTMAGGLTDRGSDSRVVLTRKDAQGSNREAPVELSEPIQPGDVIRVKERIF